MQINRLLRRTAVVVLVATISTWIATGAHRGWTQNQIPVTVVDEITGIEAITYRPGFVAGVDFLALGLGLTAVLGASAWLTGRRARRNAA